MIRPSSGDPVPDFSLTADDGSVVSRDSLLGKRYVLYFYPKDDTPGCTTQAHGIRDAWARLSASDAEIFGVSPDSVASHRRFRDKHGLPYRLLTDEGHAVAEAFGVWVEKQVAGRRSFGNERTTFVIGPDATIEAVLPRVKPDEHADQLLEIVSR